MIQSNFSEWMMLREETDEDEQKSSHGDPFTSLSQKHGDLAYFGIHDLSQHHRKHGELPKLTVGSIRGKSGCILDADPIDQTVTVQTTKAPFHFGYHKLEDSKSKEKRKKMSADTSAGVQVKIPVSHLQDITHLLADGDKGNKVWIVIDGNTKYQQNLMREIRKKEVQRHHDKMNPKYDLVHIDDMPLELDDPGEEDRKYMLKNREVVPAFESVYEFRPTILGYDRFWKTHFDSKQYEYYPE